MEKYYCEKCCQLYNEKRRCSYCGTLVETKIHIKVHSQPGKKE